LAKRDKHQLANRVCTVLDHLLRLAASPATMPRASWRGIIMRVRAEIEALLDDKPSLEPTVAAVIDEELPVARRLALLNLKQYGEAPRVDVATLSYTEEQVLGSWLPD